MTLELARQLRAAGQHDRAPELLVGLARERPGDAEILLRVLAATTGDPEVKAYARAIAFYAEDIDRTWPGGAA